MNRDSLPKSWSSAVEAGSTHYFTGRPCKHGHIDIRLTSTGVCRECARISARARYHANPEAALEATQKWRNENRAEWNERRREMRAVDPEKRRVTDAGWRANNPEKVKAHRERSYEKRRKNPRIRLEDAVRSGVNTGIKRGSKSSRKTFDLLGYSIDDLRLHLESLFMDGMTWENYGAWEVDHIIPQSVFNFETPDDIDFKRCWSLSNLQPLWMTDNRRKNDRLLKPFQPSLLLRPANDDIPSASLAQTA